MKSEMKVGKKRGKIELISPTVACAGAHCMLWVAGHLQREKSNETLSSVVVCHTNECFIWCIIILVWSISATTCCFPFWLKMIFWIAMMYPNLHCQWCMCVFNICHSYHATASERGRGHTWKKKISTMRNVGTILISYVVHFDLASHKYLATTISRYRSQYLIFSYFTLILYFIIFHL